MAKAKKITKVKVKKLVKKVVGNKEVEEEQETEEEQEQEVDTVRLVRDPFDEDGKPRDPLECDCHPDEVQNFIEGKQGWRVK